MSTRSKSQNVIDNELFFADLARVIGIGLVVLNHIGLLSFGRGRAGLKIERISDYFGVLGVAFLFILSGYLLAKPFLRALLRGTKLPDAGTFYFKRLLRIYPLYVFAIIALVIFSIVTKFGVFPDLAGISTHLLLIQNFWPRFAETIEPPMWTMAVDAQFYLALPIVASLCAHGISRVSPERRFTAISVVLLSIAAVAVLLRFIVMTIRPESAGSFAQQIVYLKQLPEMGFSFSVGAVIALFELRFPGYRFSPYLFAAGVAVAVGHALSRVGAHGASTYSHTYAFGFAFYDAFAAIAAGLMFVALPRSSRFARHVSFAAGISYAIYLFHYPLLAYFSDGLFHVSKFKVIELLIVFVLVVCPVSWATSTFIERPFLKMKSRLSERA